MKIRNESIIPIVSTSVINVKDYCNYGVRSAFLEHFTSVDNPSSKFYRFTIPQSIFNKAIISESEQFYIRSLYQNNDQSLIKNNGSSSWQFTTQYYRYFFLLTSLQRVLKKGYFFLSSEQATYLTSAANVYLDSPVNIEKGNYQFEVICKNSSDDYVVSLKPAGSDVHKLMWYELKKMLNKLVQNCNSKSDEADFLRSLKNKINNNFSPSNIRNIINYNSGTCLLEIENKIFCPTIDSNKLTKYLSELTIAANDINSSIKLCLIITEYMNLLLKTLFEDLKSRENRSLKLLQKYEHASKSLI